MKKILVLAALLAVSCSKQVTFISYNIRNCKGMDDITDIDRVAQALDSDADFVAIQEVDSMTTRSGGIYVLGELAVQTGMYPTFAPAIDFDGGKYGVGMLSKSKPLRHYRYPLPGREEVRVLLVAEFEDLFVCTAHLSLTEQDRIASCEIIADIVGKLNKPVLFAGDLNALPESEEIDILKRDMVPVLWGEKTWPADSPTEAIDYIFGIGVTTLESNVIENGTASDHRPVRAKILLR